MSAQQTNATPGPSYQSQAHPVANSGAERVNADHLYQQQLQYQIHSYQQQQMATLRATQAQYLPRLHSYAQAHQSVQAQQGSGIPQSLSAPHVPPQRSATHPSITIPSNVIDLTQPGASTPPSTDASRHTPTAPLSVTSSRPNSAIHPRSVSSTYPQSPSTPFQPTQQSYTAPPAPRQGWQQHGQPSPNYYVQQAPPAAVGTSSARHPSQASQPAYQNQSSPIHPQPQQQPLRPQPPTQSHPQPHSHFPVPPQQPQTQAHVQPHPQQQTQETSQQPDPRARPASTHALTHAQSVLQQSAGYLEYAYRSGVVSVAREFDMLNEKMTTLTAEHTRLAAENTRLTDLNRGAEEERVFLRQERARLLEELAKVQQPEQQDIGEAKEIAKRLLTMCRMYEAALQQARVETEKLREVNALMARQLYSSNAPGAEVADADAAIVRVGGLSVPKGLVDAVKQTIVQQYEAKLAQGACTVSSGALLS
ncbi:uncharacterized protein PHACADRAFT_249048 [Phanerochaete carnosa HHB-10118-sp]|uniref:Uncharacterized protein n=1 Tax=Phanerochaete carnosa (strain HHB-10118-sp) TaxID=650164 RepID=K5W4W0_PHACS|nr:uncharacterized protein PHACADRAFT_249048 [Phanerochaete carnosa HHB-10118-sp]EKM58928.1 hypothetical protein PHACADRAFT_249048 [Phanerochaete carnosa HHB-10118-sp]